MTTENAYAKISGMIDTIITARESTVFSLTSQLYGEKSVQFRQLKGLAEQLKSNHIVASKAEMDRLDALATLCDSYTGSREVEKIKRAEERQNRGYLNVGLLAPQRHGKSTFLEGVFNLSPEQSQYLIPTDNNNVACTGTAVHYISDESNTVEYVYYSEREIIANIVSLAKDVLGITIDGSKPLDEIVNYISGLERYKELGDQNYNSTQKALVEYIKGYNDPELGYKGLLRNGENNKDSRTVNLDDLSQLEEIYRNICFYKSVQNGNDHDCFRCLGIKSVTLHLQALGGIGKIRFIDTPGLGDNREDVKRSIRNVLAEEVDIVIVVGKTDRNNETALFDEFNGFLCSDFNHVYKIGNEVKDASACVHYVLNIVDREGVGYDTWKAKQGFIDLSLNTAAAITRKKAISVTDDRIHYANLYRSGGKGKGVLYAGKEATREGKSIIALTPQDFSDATVALHILCECLANLKENVADVDDFYNREALAAIESLRKIESDIIAILKSIEKIVIERQKEIDKVFKRICDAISTVDFDFDTDGSLNNLSRFLSQGVAGVMRAFFAAQSANAAQPKVATSAQPETDSEGAADANDSPESANEASEFDALDRLAEEYSTLTLFPNGKDFEYLDEFVKYAKFKKAFKAFIGEKIASFLDKNSYQNGLQKVRDAIYAIVLCELKEVLPEGTTTETLVENLRNDEYKKFTAPIAQSLEYLSEKDAFKDAFDAWWADLDQVFHREKVDCLTADLLFCKTPEIAAKNFTRMVGAICSTLINVLKGLENESQVDIESYGFSRLIRPFNSLIAQIRKGYCKMLDVVRADYDNITDAPKFVQPLKEYIGVNIDKLAGMEEKNRIIQMWESAKNTIIHGQKATHGSVAQ